MTNFSERLRVIRASLSHQPNIWRTVLIPETFSLLQLHIILQDLFGWRDSEYSFHIYHQSSPNISNSDLDEYSEIKALHSSYFPSIVYQLVLPNECDSWMKAIAPGVYIEHTHPHEPTTLFSDPEQIPHQAELFTMRILKDERVHKLKHVFEKSTRLRYEFDPGVHSLPTFHLDLELLDSIATTQCPGSTAPVIVAGEGSCITNGYKSELFNLTALQKRLNRTHFPPSDMGKRQCYVCRWYQHECLRNRSNEDCMIYTPEEYFCYCLDHENHKELEPLPEIQSMQAWEHNRDELLIERVNFLSTMAGMQYNGLEDCQWREYNNEPCAFCS